MVLGEALSAVHVLALDFEHLVTNNQRLGSIAPLDNLSVAFHLAKVTEVG